MMGGWPIDAPVAAAQIAAMSECPGCRLDGPHCATHRLSLPSLARTILELEPLHAQRVRHSLGVAAQVRALTAPLAGRVSPHTLAEWEAAGYLHDVGYGHPGTGQHAVDGARYLRSLGAPASLVAQVAWHSTSRHEVAARGMAIDLADEFGPVDSLAHAILWLADFTTSPQGVVVSLDERLDGIRRRYPASDPVVRALDAAADDLRAAEQAVREAVAGLAA